MIFVVFIGGQLIQHNGMAPIKLKKWTMVYNNNN